MADAIFGKVTDAGNQPIKDVKIELIKNGVVEKSVLTDANGNYSISNLSGTYSVRASKEGWETQTKDNITPGNEVNLHSPTNSNTKSLPTLTMTLSFQMEQG